MRKKVTILTKNMKNITEKGGRIPQARLAIAYK